MTQASLGTFNATKNHEAKIIAWISYRYPMLVGIALGVFPPRESGNIDPIARLVSFFKGFFFFLGRAKLIDAPNSDFPRYGNEKAKTGTAYIKRLIKHGIFFNLVRLRKEGDEINSSVDPDFAPPFMQRNAFKYRSLLKNPYRHINLPRAHVLRR